MGALDGVKIAKGEGYIVVQNCVKRSRCPLGGEWGRQGIGVLNGVHVPKEDGSYRGFSPHWLEWLLTHA